MRGLGQDTPTCLTEGQAVFLGSCIAGMPPPNMPAGTHAELCEQLAPYMGLPYCPGTTRLPIPQCLSADEVAGIDYCHHGDGSSPYWNALCWGAQKDPAWWQTYISTAPCAGVKAPLPASPIAQQDQSAEVDAPAARASMARYVWIGVGAVALLGVGFYLVRKA